MSVLIILHGWQSSKEKWQKAGQGIEKLGAKAIIPDLPGFKKETELNKPWDLDDYIQWFENFCSGISEPFFLLGHSFGGRIAIKFAAKYPEKLKGLILISAAGIKHKENPFYLNFLAAAKKFKWLFLKAPFLRRAFYKYILRKTDYIRAEKIPYLKETFKNIVAEDLTLYLSQIKVPTLIICGDKDKMTPMSDAHLMNQKISGSKLEILKNIGHKPHLETPEILVQKIQNFLCFL